MILVCEALNALRFVWAMIFLGSFLSLMLGLRISLASAVFCIPCHVASYRWRLSGGEGN